ITADGVEGLCVYTQRIESIGCDSVVVVTARLPDDALARALRERGAEWGAAGLSSVTAVGDSWCPGTIAAAVWDGRRFAEELDENPGGDGTPFRREVTAIAPRARVFSSEGGAPTSSPTETSPGA
ncbi:MAG: NADH:flavin oxidoreductase, partial [Acidimicrobiaceae bacterium]